MIYWAWVPDRGETRADAKRIDAVDGMTDAAEFYCEYLAGFSGDPFESLTVRVEAQGAGGPVRDVRVSVEAVPRFSASLPTEPT